MDWSILLTAGLWLLAVTLIVIGLAGLALPALPGAPLLFCGLVVAAWAEDFAHIGTGSIVVLAVLALLTYPVDLLAGVLGARKFGASRQAMIGAGIGALAGLVFGLAGVIAGPFIGALIGELMQQRQLMQAGLAGFGATLGLLIGAIAKLVIAFTMIGWFLLMRFS